MGTGKDPKGNPCLSRVATQEFIALSPTLMKLQAFSQSQSI